MARDTASPTREYLVGLIILVVLWLICPHSADHPEHHWTRVPRTPLRGDVAAVHGDDAPESTTGRCLVVVGSVRSKENPLALRLGRHALFLLIFEFIGRIARFV
jgi:hypothetical protein